MHTIRHDRLVQFIVGATLLAALAVVLLIVFNPAVDEPTIGTELYKAAVQLVVVAVGGAVIAAIVKSAELDREAREQAIRDEELQRRLDFEYLTLHVHRGVTDAYNRVKSVRRTLDAEHLRPPILDERQRALVKEQMEILNGAQLDLEMMMRAIRIRRFAFTASDGTSLSERLTYCLRQMEGYVNDVVDDVATANSSMDTLMRFLGRSNDDGGIRRGGKVQQPKPATVDPNRSTWNGPAASLRQMEDLIAGMVPDRTTRTRSTG